MISNSEAIDLPEDVPLYPNDGRQRSFASRATEARDVIAATIACIGAMSMGFALGYSSPALTDPGLIKILPTKDYQSWFGSLVTLGAMLGGPIGAITVGRLGRKTTLMLCNIPLAIGWFLIIYGGDHVVLFCGRILTGIGIGAVSLAAPMYVAEVATAERRGALGTGFQLLVSFGVLVSYCLGALINWTWLAVAGVSLAFLHAVLLVMVPESPRWLLGRQERQKAMSSLRWLRNDADASVEFNQLEQFAINAQLDGSSGLALRDLRSQSVYKPILIGVLLMIFQQFSGVNAVIFYTGEIFNKAGFGANSSVPTVIVGAVLFVFTIISCVLADYAGRRILLVVSGIFMSISIVVLGVDFYLTEVMQMESLGWLALLCLIIYIAFFSIGWGPVPWLMLSEIVPARARGFGGGIGTCINWLAAFVTTKEFLDLTTFVHNYGAFWIFGGVCCISVFFVVLFLFETKGKSLEEIEDHFRGRD